jgi:hypothetical protein
MDPQTSDGSLGAGDTPGKAQEVPDKLTTEEQETFISEMMDMIIEAKWYLKKVNASKGNASARHDKLLREVDSRICALNDRQKTCTEKKWLSDPACKNKFSEDIVPALTDVKIKWIHFLRNNFPLSLYEVNRHRDDLKELYRRNNFEGVLTRFNIIETKIGKYYFDFADRLDKDFSSVLQDMLRIRKHAETGRKSQRAAGIGGHGSKGEIHAYLVKIVPKRGTKYEAVIKDPSVIAHLEQNKLLDLKKLKAKETITLHYMQGMNGTTGVRVSDIRFLTPLLPMTRSELEEVKGAIGRRIEILNTKEMARLKELKKKHAERAAREEAEAKRLREEEARKKAEVDRFALLDRFPPDKGWTKEKKSEIERRKIVLNVFPNKEEQAFLDSFEEWSKQYDEWKKLEKK